MKVLKRRNREMGEKRENELIGQFILFYWIVCKNKNWNVKNIIVVNKIDKVIFLIAK